MHFPPMNITSFKVKNRNTLAAFAVGIIATTGTSASAADYTPFVQAEITFTDTGYKPTFSPKGYQAGTGLTFGAVFTGKYEISLSTGFTQWEGKHDFVPGSFNTYGQIEQVPVLLNYRYRYTLDQAGRYTLFAGPSVGVIYEKTTNHNTDLGIGLPASAIGSSSDAAWRAAMGGTAGLSAKIGKGWDVSASAQLLRVSAHTYHTFDGFNRDPYPATTRPSFALSVGYSW